MAVMSDIASEQVRQLEVHPVRPASHPHWLAVTSEEILEAVQIALELGRRTQDVVGSLDCRDREEAVAALRRELVQAGACVQSWIEWIDDGHRLPRLATRRDTIRGLDICQAVLDDECRGTAAERR